MRDGITARHGASLYSDCARGGSESEVHQLHNGANITPLHFHHRSVPTTASPSPVRKCSPSHHYPGTSPGCNGEFKLCGYDSSAGEDFVGPVGGIVGSATSSGTSPADIFGVLGFWLKLRHDLTSMPWEQLREVKMKNARAAPGRAYIPTEVEHIANVLTHGFWVLPSAYAGINLFWRSYTPEQMLAAVIYGIALSMLFFVSTIFHCVFYCDRNRPLKDVLHRCDRAMIYVFIAGSYYPWLSLGHTSHPEIVSVVKWCVWVLAILGIIYQQMFHERYKCLETFFYVVIGLGPSLVIIFWGHEFTGMAELKVGGLLYIIGIAFFKSDGIFPFAHAIWHLFVVLAAAVHYFAILTYLYPSKAVGTI